MPLPMIIGVQVFIMAFVEQQRSSQTDPVKVRPSTESTGKLCVK